MLKGIDVEQRIRYSSKEDTEEPKTVFVIKPMTGIEMLEVSKHISGDKLKLSGEYISSLLGKTIVGVENPNLNDKDEIIKFIDSLSPTILMELVVEVGSVNKLTDDESKN